MLNLLRMKHAGNEMHFLDMNVHPRMTRDQNP